MGKHKENQITEMLCKMKKRRWRMPLLLCLAMLVSLAPAGAFQVPASAESGQVRVLACTAEPPKGEACADFFIHVHNADCFDAHGNLVCPLPEIKPHHHTEDCFSTTKKLICTIPESDEHQHDESCYETVTERTCGKREVELHTHTEDCYERNEDGSVRVDENGAPKLICGKVQVLEHVHGPECFTVHNPDDPEATAAEGPVFFTTETDEDESQEGEVPADADAEEGRIFFLYPEEEEEESEVGSEAEAGAESEGGLIFLFPEEDEDESAAPVPEEEPINAQAEDAEPAGEAATDTTPADEAATDEAATDEAVTEETPVDAASADAEESADPAGKASGEDGTAEPKEETDQASDPAAAPSEEGAAEKPADLSMPAQEFSGQTDDVLVLVTAPEGAFPEGTTMQVAMVEIDADTMSSVEEAVEGKVTVIQAVDITFYDAEGNKIEPLKPIQVSMKSALVSESENVSLIHKPDAGEEAGPEAEAPALEVLEAAVVAQDDASAPSDEITFESDAFSVYMLVGTTIEKKVLASDGHNYKITLTYGPEAGIPADAELAVEEILPDSEEYQAYLEMAEASVENEMVSFARFFDITILSGGVEIQPAAQVEVKIELADELDESAKAVHFGDEVEFIDAELAGLPEAAGNSDPTVQAQNAEAAENAGSEMVFSAESFSVYGVIMTTLEKTITASDGNTYSISVTYGADAKIPADAALAVEEILPPETGGTDAETEVEAAGETDAETEGGTDSENTAAQIFETYMTRTADALGIEEGSLAYIRLFDIKVVRNGEKIEIAAPVEVKITLADAESGDLSVVHFADGEESGDIVAGVNLDGQTVSFEAEGFSIYSIVSAGATTDLNGQSFAIINTYTNNALQGAAQNNETRLTAEKVSFPEEHYVKANAEITFWTFTAAGDHQYYIQTTDGKYLNIEGTNDKDGAVKISETEQALTVAAGIGTHANQVRITNKNGLAINNYSGTTADGFGPYSDNGNNEWFTLYDVIDLNPPYAAEKISVQALEDAQRVIIYKSVFNENTKQYEDYVIDGNGNLVKAYDKSDQLTGYSAVSPEWVVTLHRDETTGELNGYYDFYCEETGKYLSPQSDGTLVSDTRPGVTLNGRRDGAYNSTIEKWDESAWAWYGLRIGKDEAGDIALMSGTRDGSQEFSFAAYISETENTLHPVATVDSAAAGITIKMYDFETRSQITNVVGGDSYREGDWYNNSGQASMRLDNGFPYFAEKEKKKNASELFTSKAFKGEANHLFLESVYRSTGYYEYNAFNNFAHYDQKSKQFTVYQETGTPSNDNKYFYKRGNFLPYNSLDVNKKAKNTNLYDGSGAKLDITDPTQDGTLYLVKDANFYFGMTMEFSFMQPKNGFNNGGPMLYEFNGDDDLWVYIDGVKILDIGGVHDALPGSINFATGDITYGRNMSDPNIPRTVKACFRKAGVFPDGTAWNDAKVNQYFKGETFVDYGSHRFNMFYMEHGAGASNLEMRFNLPVIEKGKFTVEKVLEGTSQQKFANVYFAFQAFQRNENGEDIPLTQAVYKGTGNRVTFYPSVQINGKTYTNVFYLKPGEAATFAEMVEDTAYYVQELGVGTDYYDEIIVNDVKIGGVEATEKDGIYPTSVATVGNRARVTYSNHCSEKNRNELKITKRLAPGSLDNGATFEFRVLLENAEGRLAPYSTGAYYIQNDDGDYFYYIDGKLTSNGKTPVVASVAGNNGTIAGIPAGYTVVIKDLLAGTDFYVEEIRLPDGWKLLSKSVREDCCEKSDMQGTGFLGDAVTADGQIKLDTAAEVLFTNGGSRRLMAKKLWKPDDTSKGSVPEHGAIQVALYQKSEDDTLTLVEGSVRTIAATESSVEYALTSLEDYVVREVSVEGDVVTMKNEGDLIAVPRDTKTRGPAETDIYIVSYETAEPEAQKLKAGPAADQRTDTITNTLPKLTVNKIDVNSGNPLPGAVFTLLQADGKTPVTGSGYEAITFTADEEGSLLKDFPLRGGTWYLKETQAPEGYTLLDRMVRITVDEKGITASWDDDKNTPIENETKGEAATLTISIPNTPGIEMPETGGPGTSRLAMIGGIMTALAGAVLTLKKRKEQA